MAVEVDLVDSFNPWTGVESFSPQVAPGGQALLAVPGMLAAGAGAVRRGLAGQFSPENLTRMAEDYTAGQLGYRPDGTPMLGLEQALHFGDAAVPGPAPVGALGSGPRFSHNFWWRAKAGQEPTASYRDISIRGEIPEPGLPVGGPAVTFTPADLGEAGATTRTSPQFVGHSAEPDRGFYIPRGAASLREDGTALPFLNDELISLQAGFEQGSLDRRLAANVEEQLTGHSPGAPDLPGAGQSFALAGVPAYEVGPGGLRLEEIATLTQRLTPRTYNSGVTSRLQPVGQHGFFQFTGSGGFTGLNPQLLNNMVEQSPELARSVMAHELGHQLMFLTDKNGTLETLRRSAPDVLPPEDVWKVSAEATAASIRHARSDTWENAFGHDPMGRQLLEVWSDPARLSRSLEGGADMDEAAQVVAGDFGRYLATESERFADALSLAITKPAVARREMPTLVRMLERLSETDENFSQNILFSSPSGARIGAAMEALGLGQEESLEADRPEVTLDQTKA